MCMQEHHLADETELAEAQGGLKQRGWESIWGLANRTELGTSGGVAIAARSHLGLRAVLGRDSTTVSPGRAVAGFLPSCCGRGLTV